MADIIKVNEKEYLIKKLLGKGKGGYSYLAENENSEYVVKQIHHEPCNYYNFGNKIESEVNDYKKLKNIGITIPEMIDVDLHKECIVKQYIAGETIYDIIRNDRMKQIYIKKIKEMCRLLYKADTNIDYFPTNFIPFNNDLYYIDFECNKYSDEWNFENWGIKYWSKSPEFLKYTEEHQ